MSEVKAPFDPEVFAEDLKIEMGNLNAAFLRQATLYAHYAQAHASMMRQEARLKMTLEITEAKLDKAIRERASSAGTKITENQIQAETTLSPDYVRASSAYSEAKGMTAMAFAAVEAFRQRRDMLIQLGANSREEMKGGPIIRDQDYSRFLATTT